MKLEAYQCPVCKKKHDLGRFSPIALAIHKRQHSKPILVIIPSNDKER